MAKKRVADYGPGDIANMGEQAEMPDGSPSPESNGQHKPVESKADKWRRLANRRVPRAVKELRRLIPLANRSQYEYTDEQKAMLVNVLTEAIGEVKRAYEGSKAERPIVLF